MRFTGLVLLALLPAATPAAAQFPPTELKNVKALPADISVRALIDTMRGFTRALGVRCTYCHLGREGQDLGEYNFTSDEKVAKQKAREMIRMVQAINTEYLTKLPVHVDPPVVVNCITCHHGVSIPRPIQQIVLTNYRANGIDSAIAVYRALRGRYYGAAAYDFGEVPLSDVADAARAAGNLQDAVRLNQLNAELLPTSGFAFRQLGFSCLAVGDTTAAITAWRKRLELQPDNPEARQLLDRISKKNQ
jgi:tetratricopeptide (TPR) repeat protein